MQDLYDLISDDSINFDFEHPSPRRYSSFTKDIKLYERCKECGQMMNPNAGCYCQIVRRNNKKD